MLQKEGDGGRGGRPLLRLLGVPGIEPDGDGLRLPAKAFVLFAALVFDYRHGMSRVDAATLLWGDASQAKAFANMRQLLAAIGKWEKATGAALLVLDGRTIHPSGLVLASDLGQILDASVPATAADVVRLTGLGLANLLSGVEIAESELTCWVQDKRELVCGRMADLLVAAGERQCSLELDYAFHQLTDLVPLDERIVRARMTNLAGLGNDAAALRAFADFATRLEQELGAEPELETRSLAARISARATPRVSVPATYAEAPGPASAASRALPKIILIPPEPSVVLSRADMQLAQSLITDITLQLCRTRRFAMFAPFTARQLALSDPLAAAAPYGVDYLVSTSIFPGASAPRLAFSLVATDTQQILVADEIALQRDRLLTTQATLSSIVASAISEGVAGAELHRYHATGAASAYVRFLLGANLMHNSDLSILRRSRRHMAQALRLAPDYVPALSGLARTLSIEWLLLGRADRDLLHEAKRLAGRAVELDPLNASGHRELGHASMYLGDLDASEEHFEQALDRAPHHADIMADRADILVHGSRMKEAKQRIDQAIALNPLAPDDYRWISGSAEFFLGDYNTAMIQLRAMRDPSRVDRLMAAAAAMAGDVETAHFYRDQFLTRYPDFKVKNFASFMPHRSKADVDHYVFALTKAGFA
jgi:DNA-binding SARP family transcriptional activator/TolB-like protein